MSAELQPSILGNPQEMLEMLGRSYEVRRTLQDESHLLNFTYVLREELYNHRRKHGWGHVYSDIHYSIEQRQRNRHMIIQEMEFPSDVSRIKALWETVTGYLY
jgi:hypothetical protein